MEPLKTIGIGAVNIFALCFVTLISRSAASKSPDHNIRGDGFAVLELFTSEGCSSCPLADELLTRIQQEAGNTQVYVLAYHVDYWNRLGWKDVFSRPEFSKRQYQYSRQFTGEVYTPQLIVNGKSVFVGSDAPAITSSIKTALESKSSTALNLRTELHGGKISVDYEAKGNLAACQLILASADKQSVAIMIWNYHDDDIQQKAEQVKLTIKNLPMHSATLTHYRIDDEHSNAYEAWKKMGSPQNPDSAQIAELEKDGQLQMLGKPKKVNVSEGQCKIELLLPRQGVSLIKLVR